MVRPVVQVGPFVSNERVGDVAHFEQHADGIRRALHRTVAACGAAEGAIDAGGDIGLRRRFGHGKSRQHQERKC